MTKALVFTDKMGRKTDLPCAEIKGSKMISYISEKIKYMSDSPWVMMHLMPW